MFGNILIDFRISVVYGRRADTLLLVQIVLSKSFRRWLACEMFSLFMRFRFAFFGAQQLYLGLGQLIVEVSRSHTIRHTPQPVGLLWTIDQPVTYTTHNKHKRLTSIPSARFEPAIPAIKPPRTYTCDRMKLRTSDDSL